MLNILIVIKLRLRKTIEADRPFCVSSIIITTHHMHMELADAGLDRPLYLRNKLYDKTLKSQYTNILRFLRCRGDLTCGYTVPLGWTRTYLPVNGF